MWLAALVPLMFHHAVGVCLEYGVPPEDRVDLVDRGQQVPVGFFMADWQSALLSAHVAKILTEEVLGFRSVVSGTGSQSFALVRATAGCSHPSEVITDAHAQCDANATVTHHVGLEVWSQAWERSLRAELPEGLHHIVPENAGYIGYEGTDGIYVFQQRLRQAYGHSGLALEFYKSYNAEWHSPAQYFDSIDAFNASELMRCEETEWSTNQRSVLDYLEVTGDAAGVVNESGAVSARCWSDVWWLSPACRSQAEACVPAISANNWNLFDMMQQATVHNMPVAIALARTVGLWQAIGRGHKPLTYWWSPDHTFLDLAPVLLEMPRHNATEHMRNILVTASDKVTLSKALHYRVADLAPRLHDFIRKLDISLASMEEMLAMLPTADVGGGVEDVACDWIRRHEDDWSGWLDFCYAGAGLVDSDGAYLPDWVTHGLINCSWCPPGRYSERLHNGIQTTFVCRPCLPGYSSESRSTGSESCYPCPPGTFAGRSGTCDACPPGSYADSSSLTECERCPAGMRTMGEGAFSVSECKLSTTRQLVNAAPAAAAVVLGIVSTALLLPMALGAWLEIMDLRTNEESGVVLVETRTKHRILRRPLATLKLKFEGTGVRWLDNANSKEKDKEEEKSNKEDKEENKKQDYTAEVCGHHRRHHANSKEKDKEEEESKKEDKEENKEDYTAEVCGHHRLLLQLTPQMNRIPAEASMGKLRVAFPQSLLCIGFGPLPVIVPLLATSALTVATLWLLRDTLTLALATVLATPCAAWFLHRMKSRGARPLEKSIREYRRLLESNAGPEGSGARAPPPSKGHPRPLWRSAGRFPQWRPSIPHCRRAWAACLALLPRASPVPDDAGGPETDGYPAHSLSSTIASASTMASRGTSMASASTLASRGAPMASASTMASRAASISLIAKPAPPLEPAAEKRAITVKQLNEFFNHFRSFIGARNMYYVTANIIKPLTEEKRVSFAQLAGNKPVEWYVSHFWGLPFQDFVRTIKKHAESVAAPERNRSASPALGSSAASVLRNEKAAYWICAFANNQWALKHDLAETPEQSSFCRALMSETCRGTVMVLDERATTLTRAWCLFEVVLAMERTQEAEHAKDANGFEGLCLCSETGCLNKGKASVDVALALGRRIGELDMKDAEASVQSDKKMINEYVEKLPERMKEVAANRSGQGTRRSRLHKIMIDEYVQKVNKSGEGATGGPPRCPYCQVNNSVKKVMRDAMETMRSTTLRAFEETMTGLQSNNGNSLNNKTEASASPSPWASLDHEEEAPKSLLAERPQEAADDARYVTVAQEEPEEPPKGPEGLQAVAEEVPLCGQPGQLV